MAKIIKGGGEAVPSRPMVPLARAPVGGGEHKVINKEVYSAKNKAELLLAEAQADAQARAERGEQQAQAAYERARDEASRDARAEAVETILRAYKMRGDALMAAWEECLAVAGGIVSKITGVPPSVSDEKTRPIVEARLHARRGRYAATIKLSTDELAIVEGHPPLAELLPGIPEFVLVEDDANMLEISGGEVPIDGRMVAVALCRVLEVEPPEFPEPVAEEEPVEEEAPAEERVEEEVLPEEEPVAEEDLPADEDAPEAPAAEEQVADEEVEHEAPDPEEEPAAEEPAPEPMAAQEDEPADEEGTGSIDESLVAASEDDEPATTDLPPEESEEPAAEVSAEDLPEELAAHADEQSFAPRAREGSGIHRITAPTPPPVERSVVTSNRTTTRAVALPSRPPEGGTRVDIGLGTTNSRIMTRPAMPAVRASDFADDDDSATVAAGRPEGARRPLPPPPPRTTSSTNVRRMDAPVDGTRVEVRPTLGRKPQR